MKKLWWLLFVTYILVVDYNAVLGQKVNQKARLFDSYGSITSEDAGARLDNFAVQLQNEPNMDGYVIGYGPEGEGSGTGNYLLRVTKDYLVNARGFEPQRIQTIYGGRYKNPSEVATELWIVTQGVDVPKPKNYKTKLETITGKFTEYKAWDGFADGADGPSLGNVTLAAFADILRQQPNAIAYIVAFNLRSATPGTWRRVAKRDANDLQGYGIQADRIKIIHGGSVKGDKNEDIQQARVQLWILPSDAPPPVKEAKSELTPKDAIQIGSYSDYTLKYSKDERWIFEGFADVLRANEQLNVCIIVRPQIRSEERYVTPDEPPDIDPLKLVEKWKSELMEKYRIKESRIIVIHAAADEVNKGTVEVWVVPLGVALPDPYASPNDEI
ncbi:MAG TPA: hypothetical protein VFQ47_05185 [Nitrososphaera sp.]|jgi:hypothetical protein|nr:hypothetical protein [Nitrososphaera sp.]